MDDLISRSAVLDELNKYKDKWHEDDDETFGVGTGLRIAIDVVETTPTVAVVEVVRCKDCKFNVRNKENDPLDATDYSDITCSYFMTDGMEPEDFCSRGEKMDRATKDTEDICKTTNLPCIRCNPGACEHRKAGRDD